MKKLIAATLALSFLGWVVTEADDVGTVDGTYIAVCEGIGREVGLPNANVEDIGIDILTEDSYVEPYFSEAEAELIARLVLAEAEGESELGKRLVIDTVLNRVESEYFPDTVFEVIYEPWQFTPVYNGRLDAMEVCRDIVDMVYEELISRTDAECVFFQAGWYSPWGISLYQEGGHYFSKCKYE